MTSLRELEFTIRKNYRDQELPLEAETLASALRELQPGLPHTEQLVIVDTLLAGLADLGPLQPLLLLDQLTDIVVNAHNDVWVDCGLGMEKVHCTWRDECELRDFAVRLANLAHRRLDESNPWVDARLPNGLRLHAVIPPLSVRGTTLSLRIPARTSFTLETMVETGALSNQGLGILKQIISSGVSFVVCGGTGTGKTTVLAAMLANVATSQRLVVVEDTAELAIQHPHIVSLQTRMPNTEGVGAVSMQTLIRQALRMRPDRLIVGEVRGVEVADLLIALNTGHEGSATTVHANSAQTIPERIEALGLLAGIPQHAIHAQLVCGIQVIIQMQRVHHDQRLTRQKSRYQSGQCPPDPHGPIVHGRKVHSIHVLQRNEHGFAHTIPAINLLTNQSYEPGAAILSEFIGVPL